MTPARTIVAALAVLATLSGCDLLRQRADIPTTLAAANETPSYGYRPLDPLTATLDRADVEVTNCRILELLPDETVRLAVGEVDASGNVTYGLAKAGYKGRRYVVVLDYTKSDTRALPASITTDARTPPATDSRNAAPATRRSVPTYVGVGLRLSASLVVNEGSVDLGNLILIGAAAQTKQVTGTLVFQTLGISGESVASAIPIPSEISATSIQNALVALGTIKSKIYDERTTISPRVVGIYDVFGADTEAFDAFFASVLVNPPGLRQRAKSSRCPTPAA